MKFLLVTICVLGLASTLTRADPCPCQTTTTPAPDCGCDCGGDGGDGSDGSDASWNQGVTHYWPFDNDLQDHVGPSNIQACVGNWLWDTDRNNNENSSFTFTDAFCVLPEGIYFSGPFTIAMWFKIPDTQQNGTITLIQFSSGIWNNRIEIAISWDSDSQPKATLLLQEGNQIIGEVFGQTEIVAGDWTHLAATFDGMTGSLYINGELDHQQNVSQPLYGAYRDSNSFGGCCNDAEAGIVGGFRIAATYDDVRIYGRDLNAEEVSQLAGSQNNVAPSNEHPEDDEPVQCNNSPNGFCMVNCSTDYSFFLHHGNMADCLHGQHCCIALPEEWTEENPCHNAGAFCVQDDSCRVQDLVFVDGCDQSSVLPVCCSTWHYYMTPNDYFDLDNETGQHCNGADFGCAAGGDCCSFNCMGSYCA